MIIEIILLIISFYLLFIVTEHFFVKSLERLSQKLKLSSEVAGATLMAIGSSAPELFTSLIAVFSLKGIQDVGSGTIVGSAIFNILVIIGVSAMFRKAVLTWQPVMRDLLFYSLSIIMLLITFQDSQIQIWEAGVFVVLYAVYIYCVKNWGKWFTYEVAEIKEEQEKKPGKLALFIGKLVPKNNLLAFVISIIAIGILSYVMVESAVSIAHLLGIAPVIIALLILAPGTSVPDLFSSINVAKKGRGDMAISNAVGSNIFDILFGLGVPWLIFLSMGNTITVGTENLISSVLLLFSTIVAVFFILIIRKWEIGKRFGFLLVLAYAIYVGYTIMTALA